MNRYRVILDFQASDRDQAAAIAASPERLRDARMRIVNVDFRRNVRYALFVIATIVFWIAVAAAAVRMWRMVP